MHWGLIPIWAKGNKRFAFSTINARAETLLEKPMWKKLVDTKRCLVPATGFYEWKKIGTDKQPFYIKLKDESVFAMAGLYEEWTEQESGEIVMSFSIVTTAPNKSMREIHDRMPVILDKTEEKEWLNEELSGSDVMPLLNSYPDKGMELYPVDKAVGKVANNTIELTYPLNEAT
jgi:putative SOS response-associated peptidase YedK